MHREGEVGELGPPVGLGTAGVGDGGQERGSLGPLASLRVENFEHLDARTKVIARPQE